MTDSSSETSTGSSNAPSNAFRRYAPALVLAATIWCTSPVLGLVRDALFARFSSDAVRLLAIALGTLLVLVLGVSVWWVIRTLESTWQWTGLALVLGLLFFQLHGFQIGIPASDVAEKIHIAEFGLLAALLYRAARKSPRLRDGSGDLTVLLVPFFGAALAGVVDESVQGFFQLRTGDIRDVALNALAGATGLTLSLTLWPPVRWQRLPPPRRGPAALVAATILAAGLFFFEAHLGYQIDDPEIGRFVSWFDRDKLLRLQTERAERWAEEPPALHAWQAEDYYLTEAAWHANHRNASLENGDPWSAAQANRVLEAYYAPFLDLESFRDAGPNRWHTDFRNRLYAEQPAKPEIYVSPVLQSRLTTGIPGASWLAAVGVGAALAYVVTAGGLRSRPPRPGA